MLPAQKIPLGGTLVRRMIYSSLQKHFDRIYFRSATPITAEQRRLPLIFCANHSNWWDGYVAALLERHLKLDAYLMMEEAQLRRYFFFRWVGCFSVDRHNARSAVKTIQYAARVLKGHPGRFVWLFPQGEIAPNDRRPLVFFRGAAHLAKLAAPALLYPVATRIEYMAEQHPDLYISIGQPLLIGEEELHTPDFLKNYTKLLETKVTDELDQLRADIVAGQLTTFTTIMHGKASANRMFDAILLRKQINRQ